MGIARLNFATRAGDEMTARCKGEVLKIKRITARKT
jgi:hypothetical protein